MIVFRPRSFTALLPVTPAMAVVGMRGSIDAARIG
jgi:hypothetical protein